MTSKKNEDSEDKKNSKYIVIPKKKKILIYMANSFQRLFQDYPCIFKRNA